MTNPLDLSAVPAESGLEKSSKKEKGLTGPAKEMLEKHRTMFISEEISPKLTRRIVPGLLWLDSQSDDPIRLFINTPGGSADDGFAIHDSIRFIRSPVFCITNGLNASAGTIILLASPKERRFSLPNSRIMIHQPSSGVQGKASDIEVTADEIMKLRHRCNVLIAEETGRSVEQVEKDTNRDCWLSPTEALEYGLIGKVLTSLNDL
ncbi:MAG TPA: ATP-dependent Clp protease proteolytic subunit [Planctomycetes bacterium]|nr:ATP-dependent Clp protease proteolytic subunit [Planctomycetota bacterium]HIN80188.1 ATP-dependent Clp protease proteolytic subunit [Planctomycetota bacterium]